MKVLRTNKFALAVIWNQLRNTPPREFTTYEEIEKVKSIIELLAPKMSEYSELIDQFSAIKEKFDNQEIKDQEFIEARSEFYKNSNALDLRSKKVEEELSLEESIFNKLFDLFQRFGKNWFNNIDELLEFRNQIIEANNSSKV